MIRAPGHPVRMAERDRAAVRVELVAERVDAELAADGQHLRGERLVQLHHVDVVDRHAGLLEHLAHALDRADAHDLRLDARDRRRDDPRARRRCRARARASLDMTTTAPRRRSAGTSCRP
jgi:hypothetical protein